MKTQLSVSLVPRLHSPAFYRTVYKSGEGAWYISSRRDVGCVVWCVILLIQLRVTFIDLRRSKPLLHVRLSSTNGRSAKSRRKLRLESCLSFSKSGRTIPTKDEASQVSSNGD